MEYDFAEALISFREQSNFQCVKKSDNWSNCWSWSFLHLHLFPQSKAISLLGHNLSSLSITLSDFAPTTRMGTQASQDSVSFT